MTTQTNIIKVRDDHEPLMFEEKADGYEEVKAGMLRNAPQTESWRITNEKE